jgi:hypothetical protein
MSDVMLAPPCRGVERGSEWDCRGVIRCRITSSPDGKRVPFIRDGIIRDDNAFPTTTNLDLRCPDTCNHKSCKLPEILIFQYVPLR